jgi:hypothetical protein
MGKVLYQHIMKSKPEYCLKLGFAHGVATCYVAAALRELGRGQVTAVDLLASDNREPNLESLLEANGLTSYVNIQREKSSYT